MLEAGWFFFLFFFFFLLMVPGIQPTELLSVSKVVDCGDLSMDVGVSDRPERGL